ncbi:MAG: 2Fe-2S iron-sulfur cluster binding domain-containing protein [Zhongshania sp.]|uniref:2Fe-2S iron-sulfur cluster binding domain-containing protein n=1 Tax=Zhongshania sp. TaxID=1971902 RepID=UPI00260FC336|nr:2Fe-2S iron-sulfur cluster binding domain-containing protein [Zhongshania sp.]MDF1693551.1 2Fe-2S iron-sulfur cluster binding domain-containing protein [Zhongshania sp.]
MNDVRAQRNLAAEQICSVSVGDSNKDGFSVNRNDMLLKAALDQGIDYPHNCRVGVCGQCKTKLISGKVTPMVDLALSPLTNAEIESGYFLACQGKVRGNINIEIKLGQHHVVPEQQVAGRISLWKRLPGEVIELRIALETPFQYEAGQYGFLAESGSFVRRCFSFSDAPPAEAGVGATEVGFLIKRLPGGQFSEWLFKEDRTGLKMWLHGPYGVMGIDDADTSGICVAGGTGLAPVLSILEQRLSSSAHAKFVVIFGVKFANELFAMDKLAALQTRFPGRVRIIPIVSHEPENSTWQGARGLVTAPINEQLGVDFSSVAAFVCGGLPMVNAVEAKLIAMGMNPERIHADKFMPTG